MANSGKRADLAPNDAVAAKKSKKSASDEVFTTHTPGHVPYDAALMRKPDNVKGSGSDSRKIVSWNVAGLRAFLKKAVDDLKLLNEKESFDVLLLQEHKLQEAHIDEIRRVLESEVFGEEWHYYWNCSTEKKGYSGVALISKTEPLSVAYGVDGLAEAELEGG
jgi:hypothetical protein